MGAKEQIGKLEALLGRIKTRAAEPRPVPAVAMEVAPAAPIAAAVEPAPIPSIDGPVTAPPPAEAVALRDAEPVTPPPPPPPTPTPVPEAPPPMESRARLVAAEERGADEPEVVELDDRHIVQDDGEVSVSVVEAEGSEAELIGAAEAEALEAAEAAEAEAAEAAPPSSKRPIAEPIVEPPPVAVASEARHTPPPESGKQVAALSFDDDLTGVRESNKVAPAPVEPSEAAIPLASQPPAKVAAAADEMEADLPLAGQAPGQYSPDLSPPSVKPASKPPSVRLPSERPPAAAAMEPDRTEPKLADAKAAAFEGSVAPWKPATFAELLEASLGL